MRSLQTDQLVAAYSNSFKRYSLQPEELAAAYFNKSFEQHSFQRESLQQDELPASCFQSPTRATQLDSFQQLELCRSILDDFDQLDLEMSLSFPGLSRNQLKTDSFRRSSFGQIELYSLDMFSHQLDLDASLSLPQFSFQSCSSNSFEKRALHCAALPFRSQVQQKPASEQFSSELSAYMAAAYRATALLRFCFRGSFRDKSFNLTFAAYSFDLDKLELSLEAWLKATSKIAWKRRTLTKSKCTASLSTRSSTRAYSTIASRRIRSLRTTSFRRLASTRASSPTAFRTTSSLEEPCFQCFGSASWLASSSASAVEESSLLSTMSFHKLFGNSSLRSLWPINLVRLVLMIILNKKSFGQFSFRNSA